MKPSAKKGEVIIKNELIGLNYVDTYYRNGSYAAPTLPFIPGMEGAGTITEIGKDVQNIKVGSRIAHAMQLGSYAEFSAVPLNRLYCLPSDVSFECAIAHFLQGMTALFLSNMLIKTELDSTSTVLLRGAGSGVGTILLPLLKQKGINVIATTRSTEKGEKLLQAGAKEVLLDKGNAEELCSMIQKATTNLGATVIYDSVGGLETWKFLSCMKSRGLYVLFGQSAGPTPALDPQALRQHGSLFVTRPSLAHYMNSFEETKSLGDQLFNSIRSLGSLNEIDKSFSLEDAAKAHQYLEQRKSLGKVILKP
ncbi:MAG: zinc-binding dehydrogenase [Verrucomicrobiota bacterium]